MKHCTLGAFIMCSTLSLRGTCTVSVHPSLDFHLSQCDRAMAAHSLYFLFSPWFWGQTWMGIVSLKLHGGILLGICCSRFWSQVSVRAHVLAILLGIQLCKLHQHAPHHDEQLISSLWKRYDHFWSHTQWGHAVYMYTYSQAHLPQNYTLWVNIWCGTYDTFLCSVS